MIRAYSIRKNKYLVYAQNYYAMIKYLSFCLYYVLVQNIMKLLS